MSPCAFVDSIATSPTKSSPRYRRPPPLNLTVGASGMLDVGSHPLGTDPHMTRRPRGALEPIRRSGG